MALLSGGEVRGVCTRQAHAVLAKLLGSLGKGTSCTPARVQQPCLVPEKVPLSWKLLLLLHTEVFSFPDTSPAHHKSLSTAVMSVACLEHAPRNTVCPGKTSARFTRQRDRHCRCLSVVLSW